MRQDADGALLITAEGEEHRARNLRELAFRILGWDLPLDSLPYWVRGLELPGAPAEQERDAAGRLRLLRQNGWEVAYLDWTPAGVRGLPSKLDIQGERLRLRLVVEAWRIDARPR
jgi:outer membrane lipoprotein LolB